MNNYAAWITIELGFLRSEGLLQEFKELVGAAWMQIERSRTRACGKLAIAHRPEVPLIAGNVLNAGLAIAVIHVGRLPERSRTGTYRATIGSIDIADVKVKTSGHRRPAILT